VSFTYKLFYFFQRIQDNGGSTVGLLTLTAECRSVQVRVFLASARKPLPKQMHCELLLKRQNQSITQFVSAPEGSTPEVITHPECQRWFRQDPAFFFRTWHWSRNEKTWETRSGFTFHYQQRQESAWFSYMAFRKYKHCWILVASIASRAVADTG